MELSLFDTHCDTAYELFHRGVHLDHNDSCHISLDQAAGYKAYAQYYAIWSNRRLDDETCWSHFLAISDNFAREIERIPEQALQVTSASDLEKAVREGRHAAILAVEDARLTAGKLERLDELKARGVRYLTLLWGGDTCVGGSHNTENGLTDFGKDLVKGCFERGIVPDVSHASEQSVDDVIPIACSYGKPFIATHSNAHTLYGHTRNLRDRHFAAIKELGGIVGVSLCPSHLRDTSLQPATAEDVFAHVDYYLSLGGQDMVGFGADWDGTDLPQGFFGVKDLEQVAEIMASHNYSEKLIHKLFWQNFYDFAMRNL
ncbi:MAG: membrane dipeptidase [Clostridia bacterium]|nr:membrane dipeptidase [Clostridia bacterium]